MILEGEAGVDLVTVAPAEVIVGAVIVGAVIVGAVIVGAVIVGAVIELVDLAEDLPVAAIEPAVHLEAELLAAAIEAA
ncbi:MAG: hypothetical protein GY826_35550, partial [Fuerstiella sp.]|nr:hypothetical protein [Fuerstiella sp.]